jgi:hypothetical protein
MKYCQCNDNELSEQRIDTFTEKLHLVSLIYLTEYRLFITNSAIQFCSRIEAKKGFKKGKSSADVRLALYTPLGMLFHREIQAT